MSWSEISITDFADVNSTYVVDVREIDEYTDGHIPGAINVPLSELTEKFSSITKHETIYVVCQLGGRSARACEFLSNLPEFDGSHFINVVGGTAAWIIEGNEVMTGDRPS
jgi:rhodanese-related sulfurtransferase